MDTGTTAENKLGNTKNGTFPFHIQLHYLHLQLTFSISGVTGARFILPHQYHLHTWFPCSHKLLTKSLSPPLQTRSNAALLPLAEQGNNMTEQAGSGMEEEDTRVIEQVTPEWQFSKEIFSMRIQKLVKLFYNYKLHELKAVTKLSSGENPKVRKKKVRKHATQNIPPVLSSHSVQIHGPSHLPAVACSLLTRCLATVKELSSHITANVHQRYASKRELHSKTWAANSA